MTKLTCDGYGLFVCPMLSFVTILTYLMGNVMKPIYQLSGSVHV